MNPSRQKMDLTFRQNWNRRCYRRSQNPQMVQSCCFPFRNRAVRSYFQLRHWIPIRQMHLDWVDRRKAMSVPMDSKLSLYHSYQSTYNRNTQLLHTPSGRMRFSLRSGGNRKGVYLS